MQTRRPKRNISGVLLLDKPLGMSSNAALQAVKRLYQAAKAGHTGTLDPLATGLLPICLGEATKFAQFPTDADKCYDAEITLGIRTDTGDREGQVVARAPVNVDSEQVESALAAFRGTGMQTPPMYSALKVRGQALYRYAREGIAIERAARPVTFREIILRQFEDPRVTISVACSKGAYLRVLAEDIGTFLGCGAHLSALRRTGVGGFRLTEALTLTQLDGMDAMLRDSLLLPNDSLVARLPAIHLGADAAAQLRLGQAVPPKETLLSAQCYRVYDAKQTFMGIAEVNAEGLLAPKRLLAQVQNACEIGLDSSGKPS